jgi:hypothetical protein
MNMKFGYIIAVLAAGVFLLGIGGAYAGDAVNVTYTYTTPSEGDFEDEVEQHEVKVHGNLKAMSAEDAGFDLLVGAAYQGNFWSFDDSSLDDLDLHKVKLPLTALFQAREDITVAASVVPGIHSDFEDDVDGDDFRVEGRLVGTYEHSQELQWVLGVGFAEDFGDPQAYPIAGANWQATDELMLALVFPKPKVSYAVNDDLRLFVAGEPTGGEWNIGDDDVDVQVKGYRVGVGGEYQVMDGGWLYAMVGGEGGREIDIAVDDDKVFDNSDVDDATFVQVGFRLN